jgi:hypothetical protein
MKPPLADLAFVLAPPAPGITVPVPEEVLRFLAVALVLLASFAAAFFLAASICAFCNSSLLPFFIAISFPPNLLLELKKEILISILL